MAGYKDWTKQVTITAGQNTKVYAYLETGSGAATTRSETITATSAYGTLSVTTSPGSVNIYVADEFGGSTAAYSGGGATVSGLISGTYTVRLRKSGYQDWVAQVTITAGQTTTIDATLVLV